MLPLRPSRPITPTGSGLRSSSSTTESGTALMVMPPPSGAVWPFTATPTPLAPDSDAPTASETMTPRRSMNASFRVGEKSAALDATANSEDRSYDPSAPSARGSSTASISGRAMASPVIMMTLTFSSSTAFHTPCASNLSISTMR